MVDNNDGDDHGHNKFLMKVGGDHASTSMGSHDHEGYCIKEQDRLLPIANVGRIMKQTLPTNAKISKEAKETMQECVSEFIGFVTGEASDKCHKEKRKTINGDDICWAMGTLGFDNYVEPLKRYLHKYRELEGERANQNKANNGDQSSSIIYESAQATKNQSSSSSALAPFKFDFINEKSNISMS